MNLPVVQLTAKQTRGTKDVVEVYRTKRIQSEQVLECSISEILECSIGISVNISASKLIFHQLEDHTAYGIRSKWSQRFANKPFYSTNPCTAGFRSTQSTGNPIENTN